MSLAVALVAAGGVGRAAAQTTLSAEAEPATAPPSAMQAKVQPVAASLVQDVTLATGKAVVVDVSEPLTRASVADPQVADVSILSPRQVLVTGKALGMTEIVLWDKNEKQLAFSVTVEMDLTPIKQAIERAAPGAPIGVKAVRDTIILDGFAPDIHTADRVYDIAKIMTPNVANQIKIAGEQQVLLRCTVAEVNKTSTRELGINGWLAGDNVRDMFVVNQIDGINPVNIGAAANVNVIQSGGIPFVTDASGLPLSASPTMSLGFPRVQMQLFVQAMRDNGLLRVLAEPNLVALNGQEARFLVGGEIPYPAPSATGTPGIEYKEFGIQLKFLATVIGRQMIRLTVAPTVSEVDFSIAVNGVPGLRSRSASTTIELCSGSTIAIAGLLSESVRGQSRKVPALGDVPVLGALFSSVSYQKSTTELVILVTPELVSPMNPDQVAAVPGQHIKGPDDFELFGLGLVEGRPMSDETGPDDALRTSPEPRYKKYSSPPEQMSLHGPWGHAESWETVQ